MLGNGLLEGFQEHHHRSLNSFTRCGLASSKVAYNNCSTDRLAYVVKAHVARANSSSRSFYYCAHTSLEKLIYLAPIALRCRHINDILQIWMSQTFQK